MARQFLAYNYVGVAWAKIAQMYAIICAHPGTDNTAELAAVQRASYMLRESGFLRMLCDGGKARYDKNGNIASVEYRGFRFQPLGDAEADENYFEYVRGYLHASTAEFMTYRDLADGYKVDGYNLSFKNALNLMDDFVKNGYSPDFCGYDATQDAQIAFILKLRECESITEEQFRIMSDKERALCIKAIINSLSVGFVDNYVPFDSYDIKSCLRDSEAEYLRKERLLDGNAKDGMIQIHFPDDTKEVLKNVCEKTLQLYVELDGITYFLPAVICDGFDMNDKNSILDKVQTYAELEMSLNTKFFRATYPYHISQGQRKSSRYEISGYCDSETVKYYDDEQFIGDMDISLKELAPLTGIMQYVPQDLTLVMLTEKNRDIEPDPMARW